MNGTTLTLGIVGALAAAGALGRRGSFSWTRPNSDSLVKALLEEDENFVIFSNPWVNVTLWDLYEWSASYEQISEIQPDKVMNAMLAYESHFGKAPTTVYRGLRLRPGSSFSGSLGFYWTLSRDVAFLVARGEHNLVKQARAHGVPQEPGSHGMVLIGQISDPSKIDWRDTMEKFFKFSLDHRTWAVDDDLSKVEMQVALRDPDSVRLLRRSTV